MTPAPPAPTRSAVLTVDLDALVANWRVYAGLSSAECAPVLKADGYGAGAAEAAQALARAGARTFWLATAEEAALLRQTLGPDPVLYVLNGPTEDAIPLLKAADLRPVVNAPHQLATWLSAGGGDFALHVDTGMNRLGASPEELPEIRHALADRAPALIMSHLACPSDSAHPMNARQKAAFDDARALFPAVAASLSASAGAALGPDFAYDMLRIGIGLHGDNGMNAPTDGPALRQVATLTAPILQLRTVPPGQTVGYSATYSPARAILVATIALGYADGYMRAASNRGFGVLDGSRCPVVGRVSMDLITLDVTDAPSARIGAMVQMLGPEATLRDLADASGTISYEVATSFGRVARRHVGGAL